MRDELILQATLTDPAYAVEDERVRWAIDSHDLVELIGQLVTDPACGDDVMEALHAVRERGYAAADLGPLRSLVGDVRLESTTDELYLLAQEAEKTQFGAGESKYVCRWCGYKTNVDSRFKSHLNDRHLGHP